MLDVNHFTRILQKKESSSGRFGEISACYAGQTTAPAQATSPEERLIIINSFPYFRNRALLAAGRILINFIPNEIVHLGRRAASRLRMVAEDLEGEDLKKFISVTSQVPKLAIMQRMRLVAEHDVRSRLNQIQIPTLLIASRRDRLQNSIEEAKLMASLMPDARVRIIEGMGHIILPSPSCSLHSIFTEMDFLPQQN